MVARRASANDPGVAEYHLTASGQELRALVEAFGVWGQRWVESGPTLQNLDAQLLMWDMRRNLDPTPMPPRRSVIQFIYPALPAAERSWWLLVAPESGVELCSIDPGFDVDLFVHSDLRTMTAIWLGLDSVRTAAANGRITLTGEAKLAATMQTWLGLSPFAQHRKIAS